MNVRHVYRFAYARWPQRCAAQCGVWLAVDLPIYSHSRGEWVCTGCHYRMSS